MRKILVLNEHHFCLYKFEHGPYFSSGARLLMNWHVEHLQSLLSISWAGTGYACFRSMYSRMTSSTGWNFPLHLRVRSTDRNLRMAWDLDSPNDERRQE